MLHLITGGSGFMGTLITANLLAAGEKVRILDVWKADRFPADAEFIQADILDQDAVARAMRGVDVVHHNAALVPLNKAGDKYWQVNVGGSIVAAEQAVKAGVSYFIHMSSSAVFGDSLCPITTQTMPSPVETYGRSKVESERAVKAVCGIAKLPLVIIRPKTIMGAGRLGIFQILFDWISSNHNIYVVGNGANIFQFSHAQDLMDAYMLVMSKKKEGIYNVGAKDFSTMRSALENLIRYAGSRSKVKSLPVNLSIRILSALDKLGLSPLAPWHYLTYHKDSYFDVGPLINLGWEPKYSNDALLYESYDWFINNHDKIIYTTYKESGSPHRSALKQRMLYILKLFS
ncbi:MAG: NAD-dependent epimerase/dehydratase family protein [Desulfovibrio sp.]|jgi:nucleoside-diphosphate-sugar epimerase|nr:NAD-dependent epimerase/dehydratase family protein [Desulfovibrio sp.]